jgi:tetratricopeptide (TPR) repeat protein
MAKSSGVSPGAAPRLVDLLPRSEPADLDSFLAKASGESRWVAPPVVADLPAAPKAAAVSSADARQARRYASEGLRHLKQKRFAQAIAQLQKAATLDPWSEVYRHDLGLALMNVGRPDEAIAAFEAALVLKPGLASAHHHLGRIYDSLRLMDKAISSYEAAVASKPDLTDVQIRLGGLYGMRGMAAEAAAAFRAAAAAMRGTVAARIAEARALDALGDLDAAVAALRAVVEAHPQSAEAHATLGRVLSHWGRSAQAAIHLQRAVELSPAQIGAWSVLSANKTFTAEDGPLLARMRATLDLPDLNPQAHQAIHFALGKAHEDMGLYEEAMGDFEAGNRLRALTGGLDRAGVVRTIDRLIAVTPRGYRDRQPDPGVEDAAPVLIVGLPRCGSTLIEQMLSSHPDVAARGELEFWPKRQLQTESWRLTPNAEATRRLADDYLATLRRSGPAARRITDKALNNFMILGVIHRVFPNATLVHCRRHPVDHALSMFTTNLDEATAAYMARRGDLVFFYRQYLRIMAHWREVLPADRFIEIDYEAMVADPEPQARRLISACSLEWNDACLAPHLNRRRIDTASVWQARQPIYRTSVERWRRFEPWLGELRELLAEA